MPSTVNITTSDGTLGSMEVQVFGEGFHLLTADVLYTVRWQPTSGDMCEFPIDTYPVSHVDEAEQIEGGYTSRRLSVHAAREIARWRDVGPRGSRRGTTPNQSPRRFHLSTRTSS